MKKNVDFILDIESEEVDFTKIPKRLPVIPMRDVVIFPNMIFPLLVGRSTTLKAMSVSLESKRFVFLSAQRSPDVDEPTFADIYEYGTIARIIQVLRLPNNLMKVLIEGICQAKIQRKYKRKDYLSADIQQIELKIPPYTPEFEALVRRSGDLFSEYVKSDSSLPGDLIAAYLNSADPIQQLFFGAANLKSKVERKQRLLEIENLSDQYLEFITMIVSEMELLKLEGDINNKVSDLIHKNQKRYFIQEQIRALQNELGEEDDYSPELVQLKEELDKAGLPEHVKAKADEELKRLERIPPMSPEFSVHRNFLELLTQIPWNEKTIDQLKIQHVKNILDEDHFALEKPKDRIQEFIALLNLAGNVKRQILCFVGPPGVGKTSLAKSIARAMGRKFVRISLGGVRDEAEIRGHRRTYIGAMPGKIIQSMKKAGTINPVMLLDEIDKMSMDFRGDPSSALLEVLDPEQNIAFNDHYLEVDYDLSNVMFITTANVRYDIPLPLLDRMEIIELNSYMEYEKLEIARRHILPKLYEEFGMKDLGIKFDESAIKKIIREYTREAGVRNLEREMTSVLRKLIKDLINDYFENQPIKKPSKKVVTEVEVVSILSQSPEFCKFIFEKKIEIDVDTIEKYLKAPKFKDMKGELSDKVGVATGLAWTSVGGDIMPLEVMIMPASSEKLTLTGQLGDVMKESAMAALSFIRANYSDLGLVENFNKNKEIHIHVPEGAIPKDGPSAGITMAIAMISALTNKAVKGTIAMTGEITLRGNILPIGGLKEKLLAAKRNGISKVIVPIDNKTDIIDIESNIIDGLEIVYAKHLKDILAVAFVSSPIVTIKSKS
ncbi:MAG: endopeptidase La [Candidatus Kapabacteria bacterium]|nr:endopeptidase La [Candidatus Kapabacteria bacterium]